FAAIGFSTRTWTPALAARIAGSACRGCGVAMSIACAPESRSIVPTSAYAFPPYRAAKASARSRLASHTATSSDSGKSRRAAAWICPTLPQPTRAVFTRSTSRLREVLGRLGAEERERLRHLVHAVHAVFDT